MRPGPGPGEAGPAKPGRVSIGAAVRWWAQTDPAAVSVRRGGRSLTRAQLDTRSEALATAWRAGGLQVDDLVAVELPDGLDAVVAYVAAWKAGATPMPLSPALASADRAAVLDLARPALVVSAPLTSPRPPAGPHRTDVPGPPLPDLAAASWKAPTSSGSTGRPKVVRASASAHVDPHSPIAPFVPQHAVQLVAGPLWHAAPFVYAMRGLMTGHEVVLMPGFDAGRWLRSVAEHRITWGVLVPSMMLAIWRHPARTGTDVSSLQAVLHLGARCAPWLKRAWIDWLGPARVHELYAGTESQGLAFTDGSDWLAHPGTVGKPVSGSRFRVVRPDLSDCAPGEVGEVLMRRERPTYSYVGADMDVRQGWHTLGDSGWLDAQGFLHIGDRLVDLISSRGSSVVPADVEAVLEEHPAVRSAVVVGLPDPELGQRVHAVVDAPRGIRIEELARWCDQRLDPVQRPRSWAFADAELRSETGKVRRSRWRTGAAREEVSCDDYLQ